ncbi:DUF1493 family protein [Paraburkholderia sp. Ac-20342]|uniref:DUF1493 family protein n=1 Tax=unclassified Paraburkholderia TaxID=2615204 RepID=UPI0014247EF1|nr:MULTISPECIES: DUF1493 family protein [unclassified Paraburkholderia]MBN3846166.1 DUF1493 family protein [Paraburkholderia sp. Ac-20342]NIF77829.1 DUF1493 family protein [Paraburkholderia sp. Cy-641]
MDSHDASVELTEFIRKKILYPERLPINPETSVEDHLGVTGDDSPKFMEAFFDRFNVGPGDFDCNRYFEGEGVFDPFTSIVRFLFHRIKKEPKREPLTVAMLQHAIELGVWDSERLKELNSQHTKEWPKGPLCGPLFT